MRNAILFSLTLHIAAGLLSMATVKFRRVRFVPREVMSVQLIDLEQLHKPSPPKKAVAPPPVEEPAPEVKEEKPEVKEELTPPPDEPKKKPTPKKEVKKTVQEKKIEESTPPEPDEAAPEPDQPPAVTGDMQLSVDDFPFAYYVSSMKRKIAAFWSVPSTAGESIFCVVYFRVRRDGSIESPSIETSSGSFLFDQAGLRAVAQANPLPPLPEGFPDNYLGVHFTFAYEKEF